MHIVLVTTPILEVLTLLNIRPIKSHCCRRICRDGYTHDAQVVIYNGPDTDYTGREIYVGSNEDRVVIVDVTDKNNPQHISLFPIQIFLIPIKVGLQKTLSIIF